MIFGDKKLVSNQLDIINPVSGPKFSSRTRSLWKKSLKPRVDIGWNTDRQQLVVRTETKQQCILGDPRVAADLPGHRPGYEGHDH